MNAVDLYRGVSWRRALVLAAGLAIVATVTSERAIARLTDDPPAAEEKGFDKPLGKKQAARAGGPVAGGSSTMSMISDDGKNRYELHVKDGEATAKVDGKEVPADRLVKTDAGYEIKDENGKTLYTFKTNGGGGLRFMWNGGHGGAVEAPEPPDVPKAPNAPKAASPRFRAVGPGNVAIARVGTPPKLMMGITMSEPEARLLKHLGAEDGIIVDSVRAGTPAEKAGLKEEDVIVAIDDTRPVNQEKLREITQGKNAGDQLKLHVIRDGKPVDLTLTLEKWDAKVMGETSRTIDVAPEWGLPAIGHDELKELLNSVEEQLKSLKDNPELQPEALKARAEDVSRTIRDALDKALESLKQMHEKMSDAQGGMKWNFNPLGEGDGTITLMPRALREEDVDAQQERFEKMQEQMERAMQQRQEALDREMEARQAALEKMQEQMERQMEKFQEQLERQREQAERDAAREKTPR